MEKINLMDALKRSLGNQDGLTEWQQRKRERTARALAIAFHGDTKEWRGFLTKADAFNRAYATVTSHHQGTENG
jgi:hypothetical protein